VLPEAIEGCFLGAPVEVLTPVGDQVFEVSQIGAAGPACIGNLVRPEGTFQAGAQIRKDVLADMNTKGFGQNFAHGDTPLMMADMSLAFEMSRYRLPDI
jgi:hypothetical protein